MTPHEWWRIACAVVKGLPGTRNSPWLDAAQGVASRVAAALCDIAEHGREPEWEEPDGHVLTWKRKVDDAGTYVIACVGDERPFHVYHAHDTWVLVGLGDGKYPLLCSGTLAQCMAHAERLARAAKEKGGVKP